MNFNTPRQMKALVGFAGFGGPEIALREADIQTIGIENDSDSAEVNRVNGGDVIVTDILDVDPAGFIGWLLFHFSPPCPMFSVARNSKAKQSMIARIADLARYQGVINGENEQDIKLARKICGFIRACRPRFFTLENVWGYRKSLSWHIIQYTLLEEGYGVGAWNLNSADYGVAQSRRRMIVIARRDSRQPTKPWPTHAKKPDMFTKPWRGWHEAIEDLIPSLPKSQFAPWQMDRIPKELKTMLIMTGNTNLLGQGERSSPKGADQPADTVTANNNQTGVKTLIINSQNSNSNTGKLTIREADDPMFAVTTMTKSSPLKAFIVGGRYQTPADGSERTVQNRSPDRPIWTIRASEHLDTRAYLAEGRVVAMTPRALARFQDFPDWFMLPESRGLACRGIGNALPPGMYRAILRSLDL